MGTAIKKKKTTVAPLLRQGQTYLGAGLHISTGNEATKRPSWGGADSPNGRGGHHSATNDPDEWRVLAERGDVIILNLKASGLICFDVDFRDGEDIANTKMESWLEEVGIEEEIEAGRARVHRSQNGGEHIFFRYPSDSARPPGAIFNELQVKWDGYVVLPVVGGKYTVEVDTPWDELGTPPDGSLVVREAKQGASQIGGIMSRNDAIQVLRENSDGQRHEAINALAMYVVRDDPDLKLEATVAAVADLVREHMPENDRKTALLDIQIEPACEITRSCKPLMPGGKLREKAVGVTGTDRLASLPEMFEKYKHRALVNVDAVVSKPRSPKERSKQQIETSAMALLGAYDHDAPEVEFELIPSVIKDVVRLGELGVVVGLPGIGKTPLMMLIAAALCTGRGDLIGLDIDRPYSVAIMNAEQSEQALRIQFKATLEHYGLRPIANVMIAGQERLIEGEDDLAELVNREGGEPAPTDAVEVWKAAFEAAQIEFLMMDPVNEFQGGDEDKRADAKLLIKTMKDIMHAASDRQMAGLQFAHTGKVPQGKAEDFYRGEISAQRGSSAAAGRIDAHSTLTPYLPVKEKAKLRAQQIDRDDPTPNLIEWYVKKAKMAEEQVVRFYELFSSAYNAAVPIARVVSKEEVQQAANAKAKAGAMSALSATLEQIGEYLGWKLGMNEVTGKAAGEALGLEHKQPSWAKTPQLSVLPDAFGDGWHSVGDHEMRYSSRGEGKGTSHFFEIKEKA